MRRFLLPLLAFALVLIAVAEPAYAQRRGGGGRGGGFRGGGGGFRGGGGFGGGGAHFSRAAARPSVTARPATRPSFSGGSIARPATPTSRPVTRPVTPTTRPDIGRAGRSDIGRPGRPDIGQPGRPDIGRPGRPPIDRGDINVDVDWDPDYGCCYNPGWWGGAAAFTAGAVTAAAIGSNSYTLPSDCVATVVGGVTYYQCGSTWYQPQFVGTETSYVIVSPPQ